MFLTEIRFKAAEYPVADRYPFNIPRFRDTDRLKIDAPVTFFAGENGSGKSTLLRAVADKCGIHIWGQADETRMVDNPYERELARFIDIDFKSVSGAFFASETFRRFALLLEEWAASDPGQLDYFGGSSLITKSHGQCHMAYFRSRFRIEGLYLLDEPENALSPERQLELAALLSEAAAQGHAQFIVCTHSPLLMSVKGARIFSFDADTIHPVNYEDTGHFKVYRRFFDGLPGS
jgi:predicted ATPase